MRHGSTHRGSGSVLTFPVSGGALLNLVAFVPTDLDVEESWSAPGDVAALAAAYNGWAKQVRQVIEAIDPHLPMGHLRPCAPNAPDVDRTSSPTAAIKASVGVRLPPGSGSLGADALRGDG